MGNYHFLFAFGSTPTRVGNITHLMPESPAAKAFPPPTWGIPLVFVFNNLLSGLPPPAWGTLLVSLIFHRITPTHVGNTADYCYKKKKRSGVPPPARGILQFFFVFLVCTEDYPHSRGEKCKLFRLQAIPLGIPPPVWGKVQVV